MQPISSRKYVLPLTFLCILILSVACKQPETIVVNESPKAAAPSDTVKTNTNTTSEAGFKKLTIGELQTINSLDPLFSDNTGSMRAVQLIYDGLTRLNARGNLDPAIAKSWSINNDSTKYSFTLRNDIYYHDSDRFTTGKGKRLTASDVAYVFRRMAKTGVPPQAANMFMDIKGFNTYYQEQHLVYNPSERNLSGISGIRAPNDSTVTITLNKKDPQLLHKLATPLAVIYPKEAVGNGQNEFTAIGTGPFKFSRRKADSTVILSKFKGYYNADDININRVDFYTSGSESDLFQMLNKDEIYLIPQLGPQLMQSTLNQDGKLLQSYRSQFKLQEPGGKTNYDMRYYKNSTLSKSGAQNMAALATDTLSFFKEFANRLVTPTIKTDVSASADTLEKINTAYAVFSDDLFIRTFLGSFSSALSQYDVSLKMLQIRAPSQNTGLLFTKDWPLIPSKSWQDAPLLYQFKVGHLALSRNEIHNLRFNRYPWWFSLRDVQIPVTENMN